jgi:hypothetical protein
MRYYRETITFPTDICEQDYVAVRIYSDHDREYAILSSPDPDLVDSDRASRLEAMALDLYYQKGPYRGA